MNPISPLLTALAGLFAAENRPGADQAARRALKAAHSDSRPARAPEPPLAGILESTLANTPHPLAPLIGAASPYIPWVPSGHGGRIRQDIAARMMTAELVGPDGAFYAPDIRLGLWLQGPGVDYVTRSHAAEESFAILAGRAVWTRGTGPEYTAGCGDMIHHPSHIDHSSRTKETPMLAAWRWSGDISFEAYSLKG